MINKVIANPEVKRAYGRAFSYNIPVTVGESKGRIDLVSYEKKSI